jgi:hypothetical protein
VGRGSRWALLPYLVGADLVNTGLAAFLTFSGRVIYPSYAAGPRVFGISALGDQAAAGALMWVIGSIFYLVPVAAIAIHLLSPQSNRLALRSITGTAKILRPKIPSRPAKRFDLLRLPLIGQLLRARYGRMALQGVAFVTAVLVIADGFRGHPMGAMNLAGVLPWTYLRAFGVIALLVLGNIFCMSCPFMLPRELGHRLGLARLKWPRWLRSKWIAIALMILFFWSYEAFAIWDHPGRTAWLLIAYFAAAFVVDTFFRGASFCKYLCPLGQFNFAGSLLSPFTLEVRSQEIWTAPFAWTASRRAPMTTSGSSPFPRCAMCCATQYDHRLAGSRRALISRYSSWSSCSAPSRMPRSWWVRLRRGWAP